MRFRTWLENEIDGKAGDMTPASAEVIRTGLQPQVDAQEIESKGKDENDKMMAIDSHIQRAQQVGDSIRDGSDRLRQIKAFVRKLGDDWMKLKKGEDSSLDPGLGAFAPDDRRVQWMQDNQPLPEDPRVSGPGIFGNY